MDRQIEFAVHQNSQKDKFLFEFFANFEASNIVFLVLFKSPKEIGAYKHLLLAFALNDIHYPLIHLLTLPLRFGNFHVICSDKDAFVIFSYGILKSRVSICLFACSFSQTMPLLALLFIYRLIATKWPQSITFFSGRNCCILICAIETVEYVQPFLDEEFPEEEVELIGALFYVGFLTCESKCNGDSTSEC
ncbi:hypothetical protein PRIPAC_81170 [Pristionchus pacificus]|uniref:G protein-coupled receptor n=1 Tax=Pristionchus pacificus TaxID=54126 RepID=A0A2A6CLR2_PRIPA|nr:hypothetical protein PRIPAC_81170 [Pristionchus pacificus]|eukprot:PDM79056.1 G protein-coupled receptor [Pristionchus pacificus]